MSTPTILAEAEAAGLTLRIEGGRIRMRGAGPPSEELLAELRAHKTEILAELRALEEAELAAPRAPRVPRMITCADCSHAGPALPEHPHLIRCLKGVLSGTATGTAHWCTDLRTCASYVTRAKT